MPRAQPNRVVSRGARRQQFINVCHPASGERNQASAFPAPSTPVPGSSGPSVPEDRFVFDEFSDDTAVQFYAKRYGGLPVDQVIDLILADEEIRKERERRLRTIPPPPPPVVPRRKPLQPPVPSTVPLTRRELVDRITPRPATIPLKDRITRPPTFIPPTQSHPIGIDFEKVSPKDLDAIFYSRLFATCRRITALLEYNDFLLALPKDQYRSLERLVDNITWARKNTKDAHTWSKQEKDSLRWGCHSIGNVSFHSLKKRLEEITKQLIEVENGGYFDWITSRR